SIRVQEAAASVVLNKPLVVPAYTVPGFMGSATRLLTPSAIAASNFSFGMRPLLTFSQCAVPSVVLYTPPVVPAYITSGWRGSIARVRMRKLLKCVVILLQVAPPSRVLYSDSLVAT